MGVTSRMCAGVSRAQAHVGALYHVTGAVSFAPTLPMSDTVDALLPLSFLEAVRNVDSPVEDFEAELVSDLRNKRLGLSDTVYMQIRRLTDAVRRGQRTSHDEAVGLARLLGRRPDAEAVFRAAGRHLAAESYQTLGAATRRLMLVLPSLLARPIALRHMRRLSRRYLNGRISRVGSSMYLEVARSVTQDTAPRSIGCTYYEAGLKELLRLLVNSAGAVEHVRCASRGEGACSWRAEWKPISPTTE
jgi:predicted hydrocarbon binding protein